jgi:exopolyphosphatase/guanosine-5'-triphosphate,3'-diphosphate pyrophosphatase
VPDAAAGEPRDPSSDSLPCYAAVDLGSNSFHLLVAHLEGGRLTTVDRIKDPVRLASGLDPRGRLTGAALDRALACLQRFRQRLRGIPPERIRVAGTNALRQAKNAETVLALAEEALGHPIDIIAGREEARLIYLGVAHALQDDHLRRLVLDIGGGSTEIIVGSHFEPEVLESLHMGCVSFSGRYFPDGVVTAERLDAARLAALKELEPVQSLFRSAGWGAAIGASGTIQAVRDLSQGLGCQAQDCIEAEGLARIRRVLLDCGRVELAALPGLQPDRVPVFPGGFAILEACFEALGLRQLQVSEWALREGLLYDLVGRAETEDVRERSVAHLMRRFRVDAAHAARVAATATALFDAVADAWQLDAPARRVLEWAARLHELGLAIAHSQYHKHGGYLLKHIDLPGFARGEQRLLAFLVRAHRRRYPEDERRELFLGQRRTARALSVLLRLAVLLHRSRSEQPLPEFTLRADEDSLRIEFPRGWLAAHPLTAMDLAEEAERLRDADLRLVCPGADIGAKRWSGL